MRKNKVIKFAAIALLSAFALTACNDDIIAKPTGYGDDSPVVTIKDDNGNAVKVYNNNFDDIYDGIRSGSLASDVLDTLLYQYSMSVFGNYNKVTAATVTNNPYGEVTLKQAVAGLTQTGGVYSGSQATKDFIKAHSAYWNKDKDGKPDDKCERKRRNDQNKKSKQVSLAFEERIGGNGANGNHNRQQHKK